WVLERSGLRGHGGGGRLPLGEQLAGQLRLLAGREVLVDDPARGRLVELGRGEIVLDLEGIDGAVEGGVESLDVRLDDADDGPVVDPPDVGLAKALLGTLGMRHLPE